MRYSQIVVSFLITCAVITSGIVVYYSYRYDEVKADSIVRSTQEALHQLSYSEREYHNLKEQLFSIVSLLRQGRTLHEFVQSENPSNRSQLEQIFASVAIEQKWFNGLGFIDDKGFDQIHVDYLSGKVNVLDEIANFSQSSLFQYAQSLKNDEIGVWGQELEDEPDTFFEPYIPTIQIITPVSINGERKGYILVSVDVSKLVDKLNYTPRSDLTPAIVGSNGYLVTGNREEQLLNGVSNQKYHGLDLPKYFPETWRIMKNSESHYVQEDGNLLVFKPLDKFFGHSIHLVIRFTPEQLADRASHKLDDLIKEGFFVFMIMLVFALPTASMSLHYHHRNIESKLARAALDGMTAVMISDKSHHVIKVNSEFEQMVGLSGREIRGSNALKTLLSHNGMEFILNVLEEVSTKNIWEGEVECITPEGHHLTTIMRIQAIIEAGKVSYFITSIVDISERKELENKLRELSEKDSLTQLWNRRKFERELNSQTHLVERYLKDYSVCLSLIDIDYFKRVNDEQGHDQGDKVITIVAQVLSAQLRATDFLARIGGEEFAVIMPHTSIEEAEIVIERLRLAVELDERLPITISAGISDLSQDGTRSYKCADIALYESKTLGRNRVSVCLTNEELA